MMKANISRMQVAVLFSTPLKITKYITYYSFDASNLRKYLKIVVYVFKTHKKSYFVLYNKLFTSNAQVAFFFNVDFHLLLIQCKMRLVDETENVEHVPSHLNTKFRADIAGMYGT